MLLIVRNNTRSKTNLSLNWSSGDVDNLHGGHHAQDYLLSVQMLLQLFTEFLLRLIGKLAATSFLEVIPWLIPSFVIIE